MSFFLGEHETWTKPFRRAPKALAAADLGEWSSWVVKLQFKKDGSVTWGTGFYVNLDTTMCSVVLTAGHNLIGDDKKPVEDLKILGMPSVPIPDDCIRICEAYRQNPGSSNKTNDYGAILLPFNRDQGGFGLSLELGLSEHIDSNIYIYGHDPQTLSGSPRTSSGIIKQLKPDFMQYGAATVPGNSGGPVFVADGHDAIAVAVHNHQDSTDAAGQGTRLNLEVFRTICHWAEVGWLSAPVKVAQEGVSAPGLYLQFPRTLRTSEMCGRISRGPGRQPATFDILPCFTASGPVSLIKARYAFLVNDPEHRDDGSSDEDTDDDEKGTADQKTGPYWIHWKTSPVEARLSSEFSDDCLVRLGAKRKAYEIIRNRNKLRFQDADIAPIPPGGILAGHEDLYQGAELTFIPEKDRPSKYPFCLFTFE